MVQLPEAWRGRLRDAARPLGLAVLLAAILDHDWDGYVFRTVVEQFLHGHSPYSVGAEHPANAFIGISDQLPQWWAYPPLMLVAMATTYWPATLVDLPAFVERVLWKLPMIFSIAALAWVAGGWARRFGSTADEVRRVELRFLKNPYFLLVAAAWGMTDVALMALYLGGLLAYGNGKPGKAGALIALAFLVKPFPAFLFLPMVPYLVRRHGWDALRRFVLFAILTLVLVAGPFILADPHGFWQQVVGMHLARGVQGLTLWHLVPRDLIGERVVKMLSPLLMIASLLAVGYISTRIKGKGTSLMLTLLAGIAVLAWNRVVNEQYLTLVVAPLLLLDQLHVLDRFGHFLTRWTPDLFAVVIALRGFHFLTFIPPDIALPIFQMPVDQVAQILRAATPWLWAVLEPLMAILVTVTLFALAVLAIRILRQQPGRDHVPWRQWVPAGALGFVLIAASLAPGLQSAPPPQPGFVPATAEPHVAAFMYIWWQNPSHDPEIRYGNWEKVSQVPTAGYYTSTRAMAHDQVQVMLDAGIDTAIVSYHVGEEERYKAFQDEASAAGLRVAPLIELNQIYDQGRYHPIDQNGVKFPAAMYRLDNGTQDAIVEMVLRLSERLGEDAAMRLDGRPVVYFYDSYVSGVSFHAEDKERLARVLLSLHTIEELRVAFRDPNLQATTADVLRHHPASYEAFHSDPVGKEGASALWRAAHLEEHIRFWHDIRERLTKALGVDPIMINGDAVNERAGFQAGVVKSIASLEAFDGSFIYSPSFTWGNQPKAPFNDTFALWEDRNTWLTALAAGSGKLSSYGIGPAYDDTVNRPHGFAIPAFPDGKKAPSFYTRSWASAREHAPDIPAIATFNEYFEGSSVESSDLFGDQFLKQTAQERVAFLDRPAPRFNVTIVLHETASRTSPTYSEMDDAHFWGLELTAAASRALPGVKLAAVDALGTSVAGAADLVLLDGGRDAFGMGEDVTANVAQWTANNVSTVVFGPEVADGLSGLVPYTCPSGLAVPDGPVELVKGDKLTATGGELRLQRAGVTTVVGRLCEDGVHAYTLLKPWVSSRVGDAWGGRHDVTNAACMGVALQVLAPAYTPDNGRTSCTIS